MTNLGPKKLRAASAIIGATVVSGIRKNGYCEVTAENGDRWQIDLKNKKILAQVTSTGMHIPWVPLSENPIDDYDPMYMWQEYGREAQLKVPVVMPARTALTEEKTPDWWVENLLAKSDARFEEIGVFLRRPQIEDAIRLRVLQQGIKETEQLLARQKQAYHIAIQRTFHYGVRVPTAEVAALGEAQDKLKQVTDALRERLETAGGACLACTKDTSCPPDCPGLAAFGKGEVTNNGNNG